MYIIEGGFQRMKPEVKQDTTSSDRSRGFFYNIYNMECQRQRGAQKEKKQCHHKESEWPFRVRKDAITR